MSGIVEHGPAETIDAELKTQTAYDCYTQTIEHPSDATTIDQMNAVEFSGALEFWNDADELAALEDDGDAV